MNIRPRHLECRGAQADLDELQSPTRRIVLANSSYPAHVTNEGAQLQDGLARAGWTLCGHGYEDGCVDVPRLLARHRPHIVFVQDRRDWDRANPGGSFGNHRLHFENVEFLATRKDVFRLTVVKDAGTKQEYQKQSCEMIGADAVVVYYHDQSILPLSPWLEQYKRIRIYHSVDAKFIESIDLTKPRKRGVVTGATNPNVYPLRCAAVANSTSLEIDSLRHPGYGARGCATNGYLKMLAGYKVHVATASRFGFALRKIIESVAVGATPVTDLPDYDVLPEIDKALVRVKPGCSVSNLKAAIDYAEERWNFEEREHYAKQAMAFYDWRAAGTRLDETILQLAA